MPRKFPAELPTLTGLAGTDLLVVQRPGTSLVYSAEISGLWSAAPTSVIMTSAHPAYPILGFSTSAQQLGSSASAGTWDSVSRGDHIHPYPSAANVGAAAASHTHGTFDNSGALTGAAVYSEIAITDGIVTGGATRNLTPADIGAFSASGGTINGNTSVTGTLAATSAISTSTYLSTVQSVNAGGGVWADGANVTANTIYYYTLTNRSDERIKRNARPMAKDSGLAKLRALADGGGLIHFNFLADKQDEPERTGLSAQAVAATIPEASRTVAPPPESVDPDYAEPKGGPILGWDVAAIMAVMIDAIRTLDARLTALEARPKDAADR